MPGLFCTASSGLRGVSVTGTALHLFTGAAGESRIALMQLIALLLSHLLKIKQGVVGTASGTD